MNELIVAVHQPSDVLKVSVTLHTKSRLHYALYVFTVYSPTHKLSPSGPVVVFLLHSGSGRCVCECVKGLEPQGEEVGD